MKGVVGNEQLLPAALRAKAHVRVDEGREETQNLGTNEHEGQQ